MRYTTMFGKTARSVSHQVKIPSHRFLLQGGFIRESTAGRYFLLPLGMRVKNKIIAIIRKEMDEAGALEMSSPILHPLELWQESNRHEAGNFGLMSVKDRRGAQFALGGTAEEMFVDVVRKTDLSYKDLPFNLYQFSQKFRDELRARGGLLRVREFTMKDAYSFDRDKMSFSKIYLRMGQVYTKIFDCLGLNAISVPADSGYMGGEYAHEFVVESNVGETKYLVSEDGTYCAHQDVATFAIDAINPDAKLAQLKTITQPVWVKTIEDMSQHFRLPRSRFIKTVAYKNTETDGLIIAVIRGDLAVNKVKLERVIHAPELLTEATVEDLARHHIRIDYVPAWGHPNVFYVGDRSLETVKNFVGGQQTETTNLVNVNYGRDFTCDVEADISLAKPGYYAADSQISNRHSKKLIEKRGIEVGNIFQLGTHYSEKMNAVFTDLDGKTKPFYMGCYGIGVERTLQAIAELHRDDRGLVWPETVSPFQVHLLDLNRPEISETFYQRLRQAGVEVLYDDRQGVSAGRKFADADLIGCPIRLVCGKRSGDKLVEWKYRTADQSELITIDDVIVRLNAVTN